MKQWGKVIVFSFFLSFLFLWISTKSSPVYPMNDWVDANAFFTMGKGLMNGFVPYRDLFEQKGPILYFIYGIGYLISNRSFFGIFLIEVVSFTIVLCYFYKILGLYGKEKQFYPAASFLLAIFLTMPAFTHGGSCEELLLPCFVISLYHFLYLLKDNAYLEEKSKIYFYEGILVGVVLWTKFILLGFWIGWVVFLGILLLIHKQYQKIFFIILSYLGGLFLVTVPILFYFGIHGALEDLWMDYFYINIFLYPPADISVLERIEQLWKLFYRNMNRNSIYMFTLILGFLSLLKDKLVLKKWLKIGVFSLFFFSFFFNYIGLKNYVYYFFVMSPFIIFFGITVSNICSHISIPMKYVTVMTVPLLWLFVYFLNPNVDFMGVKKETLAQYIFADIMNEKEDSTLLYYGGIDGGFYTIADILPTEKYFEQINISYKSYPDNKDAQNLAIKNQATDFVIIRLKGKKKISDLKVPYLEGNYEVIKEIYQKFENKQFKYVLLKKRKQQKEFVYEKRSAINCSSLL